MLVAVGIAGGTFLWARHQLNWIEERDNFAWPPHFECAYMGDPPWHLAIFGARRSVSSFFVSHGAKPKACDRMRRLFPEAKIEPMPNGD
jgi:hypothetical protein